jgi:hypothetical protein
VVGSTLIAELDVVRSSIVGSVSLRVPGFLVRSACATRY